MRHLSILPLSIVVTLLGLAIGHAKNPGTRGPVGPPTQIAGKSTCNRSSPCAAPLTTAQERALKPKDGFRECSICPEMVVVPGGSFTMGSPEEDKTRDKDEGPQHFVELGKPFAVGKVHITREQFAAFASEWTADCYHKTYDAAPADGSAWTSGSCDRRVLRGGSWTNSPKELRAAHRYVLSTDWQLNYSGLRVARTLIMP